jgi:virginiamycin B lyase
MVVIVSILIIVLVISAGVVGVSYYQNPSSSDSTTIAIVNHNPTPTTNLQTGQFIDEFQLPNSLPNAIALDSSGNVWTVLQNRSALGDFNPTNGTLRQYSIPGLSTKTPLTSWGIAVDDRDSKVWFAEEISDSILSFNIATQTFTQYSIKTLASNPYEVALDSLGNTWFTEFTGDKIGVVMSNGTMEEYQIPITSSNPTGIAIDTRTNRIWFNLLDTSGPTDEFYVGSFLNGSFTFNDITPEVDTPVGIAVDSSGNLWLTQHGASLISEFNPVTHYFRTISTSIPPDGASYPYFVYVDNSTGKIWFNEHYGNAISSFDPKSENLIEYEIPSRNSDDGNISGALTMTLTPEGVPWFTELYTGKIGEVNPSAPVGLSIKVSRSSLINLGNESPTVLQLSVRNSSNETAYLSTSVGNFTGNFLFNFLDFSGHGNYSTTMTIQNGGSPPGIYFATVSAKIQNLIVSQVIEIKCTG